jgi:hypothetical protein
MFAREYGIGTTAVTTQAHVEDATASASTSIWLGSGLTSIVAGALLVAGHLFDFGSPVGTGAVIGKSFILVAHLLTVLALLGIYTAQVARMRLVGHVGMVLSVLGTALVSGVVLVEIAGASGAEVDAVLAGGVAGMLATLAGLAFFVGLILFGIATMRAAVFPRWAGLLLIVGDLVFAASTSAGTAAPIFTFGGAVLTCAGFVWLGLTVMARARSAGRAAR